MKLCFYNDFRLGVVKDADTVVDVTAVVSDLPHSGPPDLINGIIARFDNYRQRLSAAADAGSGVPLSSVTLRAPLPKPGNIVCMAMNYTEDEIRPPLAEPNALHKAPGAIIGPNDTMVLPDVPATTFEGEAELAVVIGKRATRVNQADAMSFVFGYMNFIDGSASGLPHPGNIFFQMKSRDTFAPIGPYLVTVDEIDDPHRLPVKLWINGCLKQDFNTSAMASKIPRLIEWLSHIHTLEPGDIIATGTNHCGLSALVDGDVVELEVQGLGRLKINVRDDLKRTWSRETRLERLKRGFDSPAGQLSGKYANIN